MPGFFISNCLEGSNLNSCIPEYCIQKDLSSKQFHIKWNTLDKFMHDKCMIENEQYIVIQDGYLLNKENLFKQYASSSVDNLIKVMYEKEGDTFFRLFRGSFSGAIYDKALDKWLIYTNHIGDHAVFYSVINNIYYIGSQVNYILDACRANHVELHLHEAAAYQMLTFGFMEDDSTYASEIKRLRGGKYICIKNGNVEVKEYHSFSVEECLLTEKSEEEWIERIDDAFQRAVQMEYDKDREYGYLHLADLSGGLDSRMNVWVAHTLGIEHLLCLTYCKADYLDEEIAKEISQYWEDELVVKPLDDCSFLYDIDEIIKMNSGLSMYFGITGGNRMLKNLSVWRYGLEHTGQCGDAIIGSFFKEKDDRIKHIPSGMYSERFKGKLDTGYRDSFDNYEMYLFYTRAFQGANCTHLIRSNYTEVASPFLDVDFLELCLSIPLELRMNHNIYKKWIIKKYPEAAAFRWEKINGLITDTNSKRFMKKLVRRGPQKIKELFQKNRPAYSMNPLDYWINQKLHIQEFFQNYFDSKMELIGQMCSSGLQQDLNDMFDVGNAMEKMMVLTAIGAISYYFGDADNER